MSTIKWDVFTQDERDKINILIKEGQFELLGSVMNQLDPEKEFELQRIIEERAPIAKPLDSKVRAEMLEAEMKGERIDTPEAEAKWNEKLTIEQEEHEVKVRSERVPKKVKLTKTPKPEMATV